MFLFLLEHVPAGPCGCASGNHEVRTITDITLSFHHFHTGDLLSFGGPALPLPRILVLLRWYGWGDSNSRIIVFPQQHLTHTGETESLHHLLDSLLAARLTTSCGLENLFSVEGLFICWESKFSSWTPSSPLECFCEGSEFSMVISSCPDPFPQVSKTSAVLRCWEQKCVCVSWWRDFQLQSFWF